MLFTSGVFFLFLFVTFAGYYAIRPGAWQLGWLVAASLFFYAYDSPALLLLLAFVVVTNTFVSRRILTSRHPKFWTIAGVAANIGCLAFFKYNRLVAATFPGIASQHDGGALHFILTLPLPIGISFFTLHGVSLLIDTLRDGPSRRDVSQARTFTEHAGNTFLYLSFFPQLIAGPITKAHQFYPQISHKRIRDIDWVAAVSALVTGYFLKSVIADNLSQQTFWLTFPYFLNFSTLDLLHLLFGYSMQIFADFAGYSLIAIGLAKLFGYNLPTNFLFPYVSRSFSEFWTRWHISLSTWMRDYLYIPLGGNRKGPVRTYVNLITVMVIGGMWHGAAWSYGIWGLWHGCALAIERLSRADGSDTPHRWQNIGRIAIVFAVVSAGWLLFKLPNGADAVAYFRALAINLDVPSNKQLDLMIWLYALPVLAYHVKYLADRRTKLRHGLASWSLRSKALALGVMAAAIVLNSGPPTAFIYFQF